MFDKNETKSIIEEAMGHIGASQDLTVYDDGSLMYMSVNSWLPEEETGEKNRVATLPVRSEYWREAFEDYYLDVTDFEWKDVPEELEALVRVNLHALFRESLEEGRDD